MAHETHFPASAPPWQAPAGMRLSLGEAANTLENLLRFTVGSPDSIGARICNDTRILEQGDVFVALTGNRNGHDFIQQAYERGASYVIAHEWPIEIPDGRGAIIVKDTDAALVQLAMAQREKYHSLVIGVGGGVGKTTTKETIAAVLQNRYGAETVLKTPANWNDQRGVALTLLGLRPYHKRVVLEMGMDRPGEVTQLAQLARQRWGIVTSVSATHLEYFPSMDELVATERGMIETLPADGVAFINGDDPLTRGMLPYAPCHVALFGLQDDAEARAVDIAGNGLDGLTFTAIFQNQRQQVKTKLVGKHLITTALAALSVCVYDGMTLREAADLLAETEVPQRIRFLPGAHASQIIDDTYNASPESMRAALNLLAEWPLSAGGRRLALLGDMRELGPRSAAEHVQIGKLAAQVCSALWLTGNEREYLAEGARSVAGCAVYTEENPQNAAEALREALRKGDAVLVKASHAVGLDRVIAALLIDEQ